MSARTSNVKGIDRMAPSGPMMNVQKMTEKKLNVRVRSTASLTNLGWTKTCSVTFTTQYTATTASASGQPPTTSASSAGGMSPITKPMLGMKLVTKARIAQTAGAGMPSHQSASPSMIATTAPKLALTM